MIQTVKYLAEIETPTEYTGYFVNSIYSVPLHGGSNPSSKNIEAWIVEGNTPEEAYTQAEIDEHIKSVEIQEALKYLKNTDWYVIRKIEMGTEIPLDISVPRGEARIKANRT